MLPTKFMVRSRSPVQFRPTAQELNRERGRENGSFPVADITNRGVCERSREASRAVKFRPTAERCGQEASML